MTDEETSGRIDDPDEDRAVAAFLDAVAPTLRDEAVWVEPPAGLADSIVAAIAAERAAPDRAWCRRGPRPCRRRDRLPRPDAGPGGPGGSGPRPLRPSPPSPSGSWSPVGDGESEEQFAIEGTELAPTATATAEVAELPNGAGIRLDVENLDPAPDGYYYQGWVRSEAGETVTIGTFHMRGGDGTVTLWSGVDLAAYPTLTVTLQQEGAGPESSGEVVLRGSIVP